MCKNFIYFLIQLKLGTKITSAFMLHSTQNALRVISKILDNSASIVFVFHGRCLRLIQTSCLIMSVAITAMIRRRIECSYCWMSALGLGQCCLKILQCVDLMSFPVPPTQLIPNVLDLVQIRRYDRPRKKVNIILYQKLSCNQGGVGSCIGMLESNPGTLVMENW